MNATKNTVAVYGATGHTGRFVVQEALRRGLQVVAVGRDAARLAKAFPQGVMCRTAAIDDAAALETAFAGCAVAINCAGPFLDTATPVAAAALRAGSHYIDVTAEQASTQETFARFDAPARAAGKTVIPAAGFYGGLADLVASRLAEEGKIDAITVAIALDNWWPTEGTRKTGARNTVPRFAVRAGRFAPLSTDAVPDWHFAAPLGRQAMVELPFSETVTLAHHLPATEIVSLLNRKALEDVRNSDRPAPTAADASGRSAQRFELVVRMEQNGEMREAGVRGRDIYAVTAPIVVEAALRLLAPAYSKSGALALGEAVDARDMLRALNGEALEVFDAVADLFEA